MSKSTSPMRAIQITSYTTATTTLCGTFWLTMPMRLLAQLQNVVCRFCLPEPSQLCVPESIGDGDSRLISSYLNLRLCKVSKRLYDLIADQLVTGV